MEKRIFETEGAPTLSVASCRGDLSVVGWAEPTVRLQADEGTLSATQEGDTIAITCESSLRISAPTEAQLQVVQVTGDARAKRIQGSLSLDLVTGDLVVSQAGPVTIQEVRGDLAVRLVDGDLMVQTVNGDMSVRNISGRFQVEEVGGDLGARDLAGNSSARIVRGDVRLRTAFSVDKEYAFKAKGNIVARVPPDANADLTLRSGRGQIRLKARLAEETEIDNQVTGRLGDGGSSVLLDAGGDLTLVARDGGETAGADLGAIGAEIGVEFGSEFADLAQDIATHVQARMEEMSAQLEEKLAHIEGNMAAFDQRAARAAEKAAEKARRKMERAAERLRRTAEREAGRARRAAHKARWKSVKVSAPSSRASEQQPPGEPVSDDERIAILNMVAEGKVSVEEAESLLDALGA